MDDEEDVEMLKKAKTNVIRKDVRDEGNKGFLFARKAVKKAKKGVSSV